MAPISEDILSGMGGLPLMEARSNRGDFVIRVGRIQEDEISMTTRKISEKKRRNFICGSTPPYKKSRGVVRDIGG